MAACIVIASLVVTYRVDGEAFLVTIVVTLRGAWRAAVDVGHRNRSHLVVRRPELNWRVDYLSGAARHGRGASFQFGRGGCRPRNRKCRHSENGDKCPRY